MNERSFQGSPTPLLALSFLAFISCSGIFREDLSDEDLDGDGYSQKEGDCNDGDTDIYPGALEIPDGRDNDCDDLRDEGTVLYDDDGDGYSEAEGDCDDSIAASYPGADEIPDGLDNDCDGTVDEGTDSYDDDGDGYTEEDGDCADNDPYSYPDATELPDGVDNDCDGQVDEGYDHIDNDSDGYDEYEGDCDDADPSVYPHAVEVPFDDVDQNCDEYDYCVDFNCDAYPDIFFSNSYDGETTEINSYIYLGSESGYSESSRIELPTIGAHGVSAGDLDGDGYLDIVISNHTTGTEYNINSYIYYGSEEGYSEASRVELPTHGAFGNSIHDLDGDGYDEIVFSNNYDGSSTSVDSYIYEGGGAGYSETERSELPTYGATYNRVVDLNSDGYPEIIFSNYRADGDFEIDSYIYWGSSGGYSTENITQLATIGAYGLSVGDADSDGYYDILFSNFFNGRSFEISSYLYYGSSSGYSDSSMIEVPTEGAISNKIVDLNNDGFTDILFACNKDNESVDVYSFIYWGSSGGYSDDRKMEIETHGAHGTAVHDLNGDGYLDIVVSNNNSPALGGSNIDSYIYWGSQFGYSQYFRTGLPTSGATFVLVAGGEG